MTDEQEELLDELEMPSTSEEAFSDPKIEEKLSSSVAKQLITSFLERRAIEMGATSRIEAFCADLQKKNKGKTNFLEMRKEVLTSFELLTPRALRLDILQVATEFVDKFMPEKEDSIDADERSNRLNHSLSNPSLSDHSTSGSS
ncbi:hypothetical protein M3Y97_00602300 [Aphelenchoides bicaudatus]|nr:hypothetical protein M3Y97_00602300 [Aphelenchoides bicaudatus]